MAKPSKFDKVVTNVKDFGKKASAKIQKGLNSAMKYTIKNVDGEDWEPEVKKSTETAKPKIVVKAKEIKKATKKK